MRLVRGHWLADIRRETSSIDDVITWNDESPKSPPFDHAARGSVAVRGIAPTPADVAKGRQGRPLAFQFVTGAFCTSTPLARRVISMRAGALPPAPGAESTMD